MTTTDTGTMPASPSAAPARLPPADWCEITDLIAAYGLAIYRGDIEGWVATFDEGARFEGSLGEATGKDEMRAFLERMKATVAAATRDYTCNTVLTRVGEDEVEEISYAFTVRTDGQPIVVASAMYTGRLARVEGRWLFTYRRLDVDDNYDAA